MLVEKPEGNLKQLNLEETGLRRRIGVLLFLLLQPHEQPEAGSDTPTGTEVRSTASLPVAP